MGSANFADFDAYTFAPNVVLTPGATTFALVLEAVGGPANAQDVIATTGGDFYDGGQLYALDDSGAFVQDLGTDATFTASVVATPEPGSVALVTWGLAGGMLLVRRRRVR